MHAAIPLFVLTMLAQEVPTEPLRWKAPVGTKLYYRHTADRTDRGALSGFETKSFEKTYVTLVAMDALPGGAVRFRETIDRMVVRRSQPKLDFDSARSDPIPPEYRVLVPRVISFTMSARGALSEIKLESKAPPKDPNYTIMQSIQDRPATFANLVPCLLLPDGVPTLQTTWSTAGPFKGAPAGNPEMETRHRFLGTESKEASTIARIGLVVTFSQSVQMLLGLSGSVTSFEGGGEGLSRFDVTAGRLLDLHLDEQLDVTTEVNGRKFGGLTTVHQRWEQIAHPGADD